MLSEFTFHVATLSYGPLLIELLYGDQTNGAESNGAEMGLFISSVSFFLFNLFPPDPVQLTAHLASSESHRGEACRGSHVEVF